MRGGFACLMYHDVVGAGAVPPRDRAWFAVSSQVFSSHLDALHSLGRPGCTLLHSLGHPGPGTAITFDDGMLSDYSEAFPALASRGMSATFFVVSAFVGRPGRASWMQLREMAAAGMSIQSHTHGHPFLSELSRKALSEELTRSRQTIEDALGVAVTQIALPGGDRPRREYDDEFVRAGYRVVATSVWGRNSLMAEPGIRWIRRCTVSGRSSESEFADIVLGDPLQSVGKRTRGLALHLIRRTFGPSRYERYRRTAIGILSSLSG